MRDARLYPASSALRAIEASVRLRSFTKAAAELGVTQSAVSQSVRQVERQLGASLFQRGVVGIEPTAAGLAFVRAIAPALTSISTATAALKNAPQEPFTIGCVRSLLNNFLLARLPGFARSHPGCPIAVHGLGRDPMEADSYSLAILFQVGVAASPELELLAPERLIAVAAPSVAAQLDGMIEDRGIRNLPRAGPGWKQWFSQIGLAEPAEGTMVKFRDSSAILEAARAGHSIAMVSALVAHHDLSSGRLALVSRCSVDRGGAYYLKANPTIPAAATFAGWLRQVVAQNTNSGADLEWNGRDGVAKTPTVGVST